MDIKEQKLLLARFVVHLRNEGIKFVSREGKTLGIRVSTDSDPIITKIHEFVGDMHETE